MLERMRKTSIFDRSLFYRLAVFLCVLLCAAASFARQISANEARIAVQQWLTLDSAPLQAPMSHIVRTVTPYRSGGAALYYVVSLYPTGYVIVSADDYIEPIIAFAPRGTYSSSVKTPMGAMVSRDMPQRMAQIRSLKTIRGVLSTTVIHAQEKWSALLGTSSTKAATPPVSVVSDMRVAPLIQSTWDQTTVAGKACYNYYTPPYTSGTIYNYPCGCVNTSMAQIMRYWQYPTTGIGTVSSTISVDGIGYRANLRGGDGHGGPYNWANMPLTPSSTITLTQRQAIGALCYDLGIANHTDYWYSGSGAYSGDAVTTFSLFKYHNAIYNQTDYTSSDVVIPFYGYEILNMINPDLDAGYPVMLGIDNNKTGSSYSGHSIICDGYGYQWSTLYHHLNVGWSGYDNAWYNIYQNSFDIESLCVIHGCIYNIFPTGSGEVISGRVLDANGNPLKDAIVTVVGGGQTYTVRTNLRGIYAVAKIPSRTIYTLRASKDGVTSNPKTVTTGISVSISDDTYPQIGNIWGADIRLDYHPTPALTLQKSCTPINAEAGDTLTYTLSYQNTGLAPATQLLLTDVLPSDVTYVSGSATGGGSYNADLHTLTWSLGSLPAGQPGQVTFRVTVNAGVSAGTCIANTGKLTCIELESPTISNIVTTIIGSHPADEWWMFQNNAQHTGRSPISGPHSPTTKWTYAVDGAIPTSSPVFGQDGTAYVAFSDNYVYAISLDGALKWRSDQTGGLLNSTPAVGVDGTIYVGSTDGKVYAFNPDDGSVKWTFLTMGSISSSPAIGTDGCIYISSVYILYALNQDGTLRWSSSRGGYVYTSPAIGSDGMIYCGSTDGNLYAIKPDGTDRWVFHTGAKICAAPTVGDNGNIYVGSNDHKLYAVKFDGTQQWAFDTGDSINSTAAIGVDGTIYVGSNNHKVYAINPAGIQLWAFTTGDMVESSPAIDANGIIYIGSNDHNIYAINPDGIRQWCYSTGDAVTSSPSIASDGTLYVGSKDGAIYAFNDNLQLSGVICHTLPDSRCAVNTPVTLTATAFGGTHLEYAFLVNGIEQQAYSAQSSCPWKPTTPGYYALQVKARNLNDDNSVAQEVVSPVVIYTVTNALSRVTLTPTPISIQAMNTPVTLKATATGGANVVYKFMRNGQVLRDYSSSDTFVWTPIEAGDNAISVLAKDLNSANPGLEVSSTSIPFHVQPRVTLTVSPTSSQPVNTAILLTANVQGMNNPRFRFRIGYQDIWGRWMWSDLTGYSSSRMATWRPIVARTYTIMVWVRESTSRNSYDASQSLTYTVTTR